MFNALPNEVGDVERFMVCRREKVSSQASDDTEIKFLCSLLISKGNAGDVAQLLDKMGVLR